MTVVDIVRETLRNAILRGDLPPGSPLVQTEIADLLEVSTTPVRAALRDLAGEGLTTLERNQIQTVRSTGFEEMIEIVEMRRAIEEMAIRRAMQQITHEALAEARRIAVELSEETDLRSWIHADIRFHSIFHRAAGSQRLVGIMLALEEAGRTFVAEAQRQNPDIRRRAERDHIELLDSFAAGDPVRATAIQHAHVSFPLEAFRSRDPGILWRTFGGLA